MTLRPTLLLFCYSMLFVSGNSFAGQPTPLHSHSEIIAGVQQFLQQQPSPSPTSQPQIKVGHLDSRLRLHQCDQPLDIFLAPGSRKLGKTSVGVRCASPKAWALYVPASINVFSPVYQTTNRLTKGHIIREQDISAIEHDLARLSYGYFTNKQDLLGMQVKRSLSQGRVITPNQIQPPLLVKRGEKIALIAGSSSFSVRMSGEALSDGAQGEHIRVKNLSSKRIVEGIVTRAGVVTIPN